jgi:hypothetical protein
MMDRLSPTSRALPLHYHYPWVPLRSTPGFMLSAAPRAKNKKTVLQTYVFLLPGFIA